MYALQITRSRSSPAVLKSVPSSGQFSAEEPLFGEFIHSLRSGAKETKNYLHLKESKGRACRQADGDWDTAAQDVRGRECKGLI